MIYQNAIDGLINEARNNSRYHSLSTAKKVLLAIGLIPLNLSALALFISYYITLFIYKGLVSPLEFLHKMLYDEGKEVKHATEFAIYFIGFPFIFLLYALQSITALIFYFQWFFLMVFMYLVTLGGVRFQPFLMDAKYDEKVEWKFLPGETGTLVFVILLMFFDALLALAILAVEDLIVFSIIGISAMLFIVNPILFRKKSKAENTNEVSMTKDYTVPSKVKKSVILALIIICSTLFVGSLGYCIYEEINNDYSSGDNNNNDNNNNNNNNDYNNNDNNNNNNNNDSSNQADRIVDLSLGTTRNIYGTSYGEIIDCKIFISSYGNHNITLNNAEIVSIKDSYGNEVSYNSGYRNVYFNAYNYDIYTITIRATSSSSASIMVEYDY